MATLTVNRSQIAKRRSSRIALKTPIVLSGQDHQKSSFTMPARATNLNRHGATIQLNRELLVGSTIVVRNKRGIQVTARVVALVGALQGAHTYGIEFVEQDERAKNYWGITFPSIGYVCSGRSEQDLGQGCGYAFADRNLRSTPSKVAISQSTTVREPLTLQR